MARYDQYQNRIPPGTYVDNDYQPPYDELPTHERYNDGPHAPQKAASTALEKEVEKTPKSVS
jgi:hypothetical protein